VIVDARLFPQTQVGAPEDFPHDSNVFILTPIMINDNAIDVTIAPGNVGGAATVTTRPQTAAYRLRAEVGTTAAGSAPEVTIAESPAGELLVRGQIPADQGELLHTFEVGDPPAFARTLLIEALQRQGVAVAAKPTGPN